MLCPPSPLSYQPSSTLQEVREYKSRKNIPYPKIFPDSVNITRPAPWGLSALESCLCDQGTGCPPIKGDKHSQAIVFLIFSVL